MVDKPPNAWLYSTGKASIAHRSRRVDKCSAEEELEPIDQNLQFDYNFQVWSRWTIIMCVCLWKVILPITSMTEQ